MVPSTAKLVLSSTCMVVVLTTVLVEPSSVALLAKISAPPLALNVPPAIVAPLR